MIFKRITLFAILTTALACVPFKVLANGETVSPNMNLIVPAVGVTTGPQWAADMNMSLNVIDQHDHSNGKGVQITPAGMNISSDLNINSHNLTTIRASRFASQSSALSGSEVGELYNVLGDLYYNDGAGNQIRVTQSGSVSGSAGTITGLPSGTASAAFTAGTGTFTFLQSTGNGANIDAGTLILRYPGSYPTPAGNYIALEAPSSLATGFAFTLPNALPASSGAMLTFTTGGVGSYTNVDNTTLQISSGTLQVKANGVPSVAKNATSSGLNVVVSNTNATNSLAIVRGNVSSPTTVNSGEGFSVTHNGTGDYTITFTTPFADAPAFTAVSASGNNNTIAVNAAVPGSVRFLMYTANTTNTRRDDDFTFIAIGQRP